ncbi:MAG: AbrB/MazE/SpoVT family DNA-binding domain-containing protein [Thiohalomonadales bacterium]
MLAKKTSKNQITLPKSIIKHYPNTEYFDIHEEDGRIILEPVKTGGANEVREKLSELGITESDIHDAVKWSRK